MEQSQPQLYDYLYYVLLSQNTSLQMEDVPRTSQRDIRQLEPLIEEEIFPKPVVKNEWNSTNLKDKSHCDYNTYTERSFYNTEESLLKSIKEEIKLDSVITENIDLKDEVISVTSGDATLEPPISIKEEIGISAATITINAGDSTSNSYYTHDTRTKKSSQIENGNELINSDIKLEPVICEKIDLKDETISGISSESRISLENKSLVQNTGLQIKEELNFEPLSKEEILPETIVVVNERISTSRNDDDSNTCIEGEIQYKERSKTTLKSKGRTELKSAATEEIRLNDKIGSETSTTSLAKLMISKIIKDASKSNAVKPKPNPEQMKLRYCPECSFQTRSRSTLRNHKIAKHTKIFYACPQCPFKTKWKDYLQDHIGTHAGDEGKHLQCNLCDFKTALRTNLKKHKLSVHVTERKFECELCPYRAKVRDGLKRHMDKTHNKGGYFTCNVCDYKTEFKHNLIEHAKSHTGENFFKCTECEYRGKTRRSLKIHMVKHSTQRSFECYECGHKTKLKNALIIHIQKHRTDKRHKCVDCGYSTSLKYCLNKHLKRYGHNADCNDEIFRCDICDYVTSSDQILKWHVKVHTGEKLFECHLCEYKTNSSSNFRKHEYIHEKRKSHDENYFTK
ncbi:hypothetical protein ILUMI_18878 [Ignelater luminosus]|uniref:C2H2-type domain-containing protein n=1 Tax=Ignelater luminosus TaxID=2038154 RepID=A0A8K0G0G2_IGNLU|nr:hypothetical protein ILUMI_18878 [Ignelater luminosus]